MFDKQAKGQRVFLAEGKAWTEGMMWGIGKCRSSQWARCMEGHGEERGGGVDHGAVSKGPLVKAPERGGLICVSHVAPENGLKGSSSVL